MHKSKRNSTHMSRYKKKYLIEVQAEAYYRALKRIENEKQPIEKPSQPVSKQKRTKKDSLLVILKLIFVPRKLAEELKNRGFADNFLGFLVSVIIGTIGAGLRLCAVLFFIAGGWKIYKNYTPDISTWVTAFDCILFALLFALSGSLFTITSKELSEMKDSEKLYAYTSGIMGVLALIVAVISIFN